MEELNYVMLFRDFGGLRINVGLFSELDSCKFHELVGYRSRKIQLRSGRCAHLILDDHTNGLPPITATIEIKDPTVFLDEGPWAVRFFYWEAQLRKPRYSDGSHPCELEERGTLDEIEILRDWFTSSGKPSGFRA